MNRRNTDTPLPVLDSALGDRIREVVGLFDRKKDAAKIAGVIPEQLNRWCQAQSEPRFVGIARLAISQGVGMEWIATGSGNAATAKKAVDTLHATPPELRVAEPAKRDILLAIISGFLAAEGIANSPQIARDIIETYDEIVVNVEKNRTPAEMSDLLSQAISSILIRQQKRNGSTT